MESALPIVGNASSIGESGTTVSEVVNEVAEQSQKQKPKFTRRELMLCTIFGAVLAAGGLFFLLHGVLSLMGGDFGLERHIMEARGATPPSAQQIVFEIIVGAGVLLSGLFLRVKARRIRNVMGSAAGGASPSNHNPRLINRINIAAILLSLLWIAYILSQLN